MIYFVQCLENSLIKIGWTEIGSRHRMVQLLRKRLKPCSLRLLGTMPGGRDIETQLHRRFRPFRDHRFNVFHYEGYRPADELITFIGSLPPTPDVGLVVAMGPLRAYRPLGPLAERLRQRANHGV